MTQDFRTTAKTTLERKPKRGVYDRVEMYKILDDVQGEEAKSKAPHAFTEHIVVEHRFVDFTADF